MVLIIDGEIVADNDPRAIARRKGSQQQQPAQPPPGANIRAATAGGAARPEGGGGGAGAAGGSPLDMLAAAIGIQGMSVTIPRLHARVPEREVPMVVIGLLGIATVFFGWRILAMAAGLHVVSSISETAPAGGGPGGGGGAPGGGAATARPRPR